MKKLLLILLLACTHQLLMAQEPFLTKSLAGETINRVEAQQPEEIFPLQMHQRVSREWKLS
jgi:hypothetical protein